MKFVLAICRVTVLFLVFMVLGLILAVLAFKSWEAIAQVFTAIVLAIGLTWWWETRRSKRRLGGTGQSGRNKRKANASAVTAKRKWGSSDRVLQSDSQTKSLAQPRYHEHYNSKLQRRANVANNEQEPAMKRPSIAGKENSERSRRSKRSKKQISGWVPATESATVAGRDIGGLLYIGSPPRLTGDGYRGTSGAYIDPSLSVARDGNDVAGDSLSYCPSYSEISSQCRATYLDWLAEGRNNIAYSPGYMFLYFYGLERRFFIDKSNADANDIIVEVSRLRDLYFDNRSVQRYLGEFLDVAAISEHGLQHIRPSFDSQRWEVPYSIKYAIGAKLSHGENLDSDWLLAWFSSHPERNLRTPTERCKEEFHALFKIKFDERFQNGLKVNKPRKHLRVEYRSASYEFQVEVDATLNGEPVPDISGSRKPIEVAQEIADEAMNDLDKLSRYLGRKKEGRGSLEAHALLPLELWDMFPSKSFAQLESWARSIVDAGGLVPASDVIERLEGVRREKFTKRNLTGAADALARIGFGMAPDPRFALRSPKPEEPVVVFELGEQVAELENVSTQYRAALIETAVRSFVVHADGQVNAKERQALFESVQNVAGLKQHEQRRLEANLNWMLVVSPDLSLLRRKLKESSSETITSLRAALVSASHADGIVQPEEVVSIEKIYKTLGLDSGLVYSDLHAGEAQDSPVRVRAKESAAPGEVIPSEPILQGIQLDASRIAAIKTDTERVSAILGEIFSDTADSAPEKNTQKALLDGLDKIHTELVRHLISKATWTEGEVQDLCSDTGLMVSGAIETINEWAYEAYDECLIDDYEGFEIAAEPANLIKKKFAEEELMNEQA